MYLILFAKIIWHFAACTPNLLSISTHVTASGAFTILLSGCGILTFKFAKDFFVGIFPKAVGMRRFTNIVPARGVMKRLNSSRFLFSPRTASPRVRNH